jgi:aspartate/methionine/tyrosine aminotransferase
MSKRAKYQENIGDLPVVAQMLEKGRRLEAEGAELIYLLRGEPDFITPDHICKAATSALKNGFTHYVPTEGISSLRMSIARRMERDFDLKLDPEEEILVTNGATEGIFLALTAVLNPGEEVILFDPVYDAYASVIRMVGGTPHFVQAEEDVGRFIVPVKSIIKAINKSTKAILINNPWNPTGTVMYPEELDQLIDLAETHNLILISDEIYEKLIYDGKEHCCLLSRSDRIRQNCIIINSFSKTYAMTGWRLGYNIAPPNLRQSMLKISSQFSRSATSFVQHAGVAALDGPQEAVGEMVAAYSRRRDLIIELLSNVEGILVNPPEGTFFLFLDIRSTGKSSQDISDFLLNQARVVTIPGSAYGPGGEGYLRLSFAYSESKLKQGLEEITSALSLLQN